VWRRVWALILKELLAVLNDRKSRIVIVGVPLMQLLIFPYASTFEVTAIRMAVFNEDTGTASHDLIAAFASASSFQVTGHVASEEAVRETVEAGRADIILRIGESFSADLARGRMAPVQVIVDGRNSNTALITLNYVRSITRDFSLPPASVNLEMPPVERSLYNPNLLSLWFILPGLVGILVLVVTLSVTAFSVAREKEVGTFEQLLVTPLHKHEIAIGKTVPGLIVGFVESLVFIAVTVWFYGVPMAGSLALLLAGVVVFILSVVGVGLAISTLAQTQQQALFGGFFFIVPSVVLSGFATPIFNMPEWIQTLTYLNPLRYFIVISRGVFLKDLPADAVAAQIWPMAVIALATLLAAALLVRRRLY